MKFKLLEIESATRSFSRISDVSINLYDTINQITSLLIHVSDIGAREIDDLVKVAASYSNAFNIVQYNKQELTLRVNRGGSKMNDLSYPHSLKLFFAYLKNLERNLAYYLPHWESEFGFSFNQPLIMGVVNVTPDSFSDGGLYLDMDEAVSAGLKMIEQGVDILDIGGESSRPGAEPVPNEVEIERIIPVIKELRRRSSIFISVDTTKAKVAEAALKTGANWINDISGLRMDPDMLSLVRESGSPVVVMHMQGAPRNMQRNPRYKHVVEDLVLFFEDRINTLNQRGINKIILDPGIGFGKNLEHNLQLLRNIQIFKQFGYPLLVGTSRKSFIGTVTGRDVSNRLAGTLSSVIWSVLQGVNIVRVHDVVECIDSLKIIKSIYDNVYDY